MSQHIRAKIKALLGKTRLRGCTEAEALAAAAKAAELMAKYQISEPSLLASAEHEVIGNKGNLHQQVLVGHIATVTNCRAIFLKNGIDLKIEFIGKEPGPQIALYLRDVCLRAMSHELAQFRKQPVYRARRTAKTRAKASLDFSFGMSNRLQARLTDLFRGSINGADMSVALARMNEDHPNSKEGKTSNYKSRFDAARHAGWLAGDKTSLNHGVRGAEDVKQLTGDLS